MQWPAVASIAAWVRNLVKYLAAFWTIYEVQAAVYAALLAMGAWTQTKGVTEQTPIAGGGKSYSALREFVVPELVHGKRCLVTNLDLDLAELAQYLHDTYGDTFNLRERVRILDQNEVAQFWLHYGHGLSLSSRIDVPMPSGKVLKHVDYAPRIERGGGGVLYIIDEVHEYFNARHWQHTGDDALHYLSQHRKLGDDVVCVTQSIQNVDKQFRSLAQDFTYLRNHGKENLPLLGGFFKSVRGFSKTVYLEPFTGTQSAVEMRFYKLDERLARCYRTAGGVGIKGNVADVGQDTRKGLHPALLIALIAALGFGVWWLLTRGSHYLLGGVAGASNGVRVASHVEPASVPASTNRLLVSGWTNSSAPRGQTALTTEAVSHSEPTANNPPQPEVFLTGKAVVDGKVWVFLSDGRRYNSDNKQLRWIGDGAVIIGTNLYQFARTDRTASPVPGSTVGSFKLH